MIMQNHDLVKLLGLPKETIEASLHIRRNLLPTIEVTQYIDLPDTLDTKTEKFHLVRCREISEERMFDLAYANAMLPHRYNCGFTFDRNELINFVRAIEAEMRGDK